MAGKVVFNSRAEIIGPPSLIPRPVGTTVSVSGFLEALPVRLQEWRRREKAIFAKTIALIQSYVLAVPSVRFRCANDNVVLISSSGSGNPKNSIAETFGRDLNGRPVQQISINSPISALLYFGELTKKQATDRQYVFFKKRPCDMPKV